MGVLKAWQCVNLCRFSTNLCVGSVVWWDVLVFHIPPIFAWDALTTYLQYSHHIVERVLLCSYTPYVHYWNERCNRIWCIFNSFDLKRIYFCTYSKVKLESTWQCNDTHCIAHIFHTFFMFVFKHDLLSQNARKKVKHVHTVCVIHIPATFKLLNFQFIMLFPF